MMSIQGFPWAHARPAHNIPSTQLNLDAIALLAGPFSCYMPCAIVVTGTGNPAANIAPPSTPAVSQQSVPDRGTRSPPIPTFPWLPHALDRVFLVPVAVARTTGCLAGTHAALHAAVY